MKKGMALASMLGLSSALGVDVGAVLDHSMKGGCKGNVEGYNKGPPDSTLVTCKCGRKLKKKNAVQCGEEWRCKKCAKGD